MTKIQAPTNCPSCSSTLEWSNHLLYCRNPSCSVQEEKKVEHFAKTLKIKGLGPAAITKLNFSDISDLYAVNLQELAEGLGSEKLAHKLYLEIENSKKATLNAVLPGFSIPLIGKTATNKLAAVCRHISEIDDAVCKAAGLGPKATDSLLEWLYKYSWWKLPFSFEFEVPSSSKSKEVICISGKLNSFKTKAEAEKVLKDLGYIVSSSLTKEVTILVNESGIESLKTQKARESGIHITHNLLEFIGV